MNLMKLLQVNENTDYCVILDKVFNSLISSDDKGILIKHLKKIFETDDLSIIIEKMNKLQGK